jgi:hypothetical protein
MKDNSTGIRILTKTIGLLYLFIILSPPCFARTKIQSGYVTTWSSGASFDVTIDQVDLSKSFIMWSYETQQTAPNNNNVTAKFVNNTTIRFERYGTSGWVKVSWFVLESDAFYVERGETSVSSGTEYVDVNLSHDFDMSKTFVYLKGRANSSTGGDNNASNFKGILTDGTPDVLRVDRESGATGKDAVVTWFVVEMKDDSTVQTGEVSLWDTGVMVTDSLSTPVDRSKSFIA